MKALAVSIAPWFKAPKTKASTSRTKSIGRLWFLLLLFKSIKQQQCVQEDWPMETAIRYFLFSHLFKELQQKGVWGLMQVFSKLDIVNPVCIWETINTHLEVHCQIPFLFWASLCNSGIYKKEQNISCPCECVGANKRARGETGWAHIARWEYQYHMAHIYSYVKLNFNKVNMFSCIFWFKDSLLYKIGLFLLFGFFRPKNSLKKLKNYICPRTRPKPKDKK